MRFHILPGIAVCAILPACGSAPPRADDHYPRTAYYAYDEPTHVDPLASAAGDESHSGSARVVAIRHVREGGHGTNGAGALLGGIAGGVIGHQIGGGAGKDAATVVGAIGGAMVGNEIEKDHDSEHGYWEVTVRFRDGREEAYAMNDLEGIRVNDRVHVEGGRIHHG